MPDISTYRYDNFLTQVSVGYENQAYIGENIAPVIPSGKRSGTYFEFGRESFRTHDTDRAPRTRANEVDFEMSPKSFLATGHALIGMLSDEERTESPDGYNPEPDLVSLVTDSLMLGREKRMASQMRDPNTVTQGQALAGADQFDATDTNGNYTGDPWGAFEDAMNTIRRAVGRRPNVAVIPYDVMRVLRYHPAIVGQLSDNERRIVTRDILRDLLEVDEILVPEVVEDTTNTYQRVVDGQRMEPTVQGSDLADVWGRDILFAFRNRNAQRRSPSFAYTFRVRERGQDGTVNRWREADRHTDAFEVGMTEVTHIVCPSAGYLIRDAIAA